MALNVPITIASGLLRAFCAFNHLLHHVPLLWSYLCACMRKQSILNPHSNVFGCTHLQYSTH